MEVFLATLGWILPLLSSYSRSLAPSLSTLPTPQVIILCVLCCCYECDYVMSTYSIITNKVQSRMRWIGCGQNEWADLIIYLLLLYNPNCCVLVCCILMLIAMHISAQWLTDWIGLDWGYTLHSAHTTFILFLFQQLQSTSPNFNDISTGNRTILFYK